MNTPGQIMGITNKTDGKSADGKISDKFTQRSNDNENYSEHDPTETVEYRKEQIGGSRFYFFIGLLAVTLGIFYVCSSQEMDLDREREIVYQRLAEREEERRLEQERMRPSVGPFRDA